MNLFCAAGRHRASSESIRNTGRHFSRCLRCGVDLIEGEHGWKPAPRGFRIVWKEAGPSQGAAQGGEAAAASDQPPEQRSYRERRTHPKGEPPAFLGGRERRRLRDRRRGFGRRVTRPAAPVDD